MVAAGQELAPDQGFTVHDQPRASTALAEHLHEDAQNKQEEKMKMKKSRKKTKMKNKMKKGKKQPSKGTKVKHLPKKKASDGCQLKAEQNEQ